jgi:hypothetical protein
VAERANAIVTLRTYNGGIRSTFQLPGDTVERRKRQTLTLGNGSAHVELESFSGTISLRRPGEARPEIERKRRDRDKDKEKEKEKEKEIGPALADIRIDIDRVLADVQPGIDRAWAEVQPEVDRAWAEVMRALPSVWVNPMPMPAPHVQPSPRGR